jgi:2-succinyl-5-enolpyruvyl-6-hydroxy-3-cyclohexene-1-carboxylate synthase
MHKGNANFEASETLLRRLLISGIDRFIVSPGSRSTPLVLALSTFSQARISVIVDERSAAFTALGAAQASGKPVALICTSGTAVANYLPAVVEAYMTRTPLLLLTADRPDFLQNTGAPQTIHQQYIFSHYAAFFQAPQPGSDEKLVVKRFCGLAQQAISVLAATQRPVHINIPYDKPLEPDSPLYERACCENALVKAGKFPEINPACYKNTASVPSKIVFQRPLIIAGPGRSAPVIEFPAGIPLLAETTSQLSTHKAAIHGFEAFLRNGIPEQLQPDVIFRLGQSPVSTALQRFLEKMASVPVFWLNASADWDNAALNDMTSLDEAAFSEVLNRIEPATDWLPAWKEREYQYQKRLAQVSSAAELTDGFVMRLIWENPRLRERTLHLSNSMPVRDADLFGKEGWSKRVFCNRGASGIDGVLSTAVGAAHEAAGKHLLVIGDLAALHDVGGLVAARDLNPDLLVVLMNNEGGTIFESLPISKNRAVFDTFFLTPRSVSWQDLCSGFHVPFLKADSVKNVAEIFEKAIALSGFRMVEVQTSAKASVSERAALWNHSWK